MNIVEPIRDKNQIAAMKKILAAGRRGERNELLFSLGINTAYRISDMQRLKLEDVVEFSRGRLVAKERLAMKEQKTGKHNSVVISNKLKNALVDYVKGTFGLALQTKNLGYYLFPSQKEFNQPLARESLWRIIHSAANEIGLKNIGTHSMRKTFGYHLYKQGTRIELIQSLLNHSTPRETLRYIGITQEDKDIAVKSLDL